MKKSIAGIVAVAFFLSACSNDNPQTNSSVDMPETLPPLPPLPLSATNRFTPDRDFVGIGPAFQDEAPSTSDLGTSNKYDDDFTVYSGSWRGPRDGSTSAGNIIEFIKSFRPEEEVGYVIPDFGDEPKTLRISSGASDEQIKAVENALRLINAALPFDKRIKLGPSIPAGEFDRVDVPEDEIHIHFTEGKTNDWPNDIEENGLGKAKINETTYVVESGYALIDTDGIEGDEDLQKIITRELLRAYGIVVHAGDDEYPDSDRLLSSSRPVFLSRDGETLLAIITTDLKPGTDVGELTPNDLGEWDESAFHLLGTLDLNNGQDIEFGAGYRNGLGKPWAYGPVPASTLEENTDLTGTATWSGYLLGFTKDGNTVTGMAEIEIDFMPDEPTGTALFTNLESWGIKTSPGTHDPDDNTRIWTYENADDSTKNIEDGMLEYSIKIVNEGEFEGFVSTTDGDEEGMVSGVFVGTEHEGAVGTVEHPDLSAGFGTTRMTTP